MTPEEIAALEQDWIGRIAVAGTDTYWDWQPYPLPEFSSWLAVAMSAAASLSFLDAGCGIGTKVLTAQQAGCTASGVDRVSEYVAEARSLDLTCQVADVLSWDYSPYGIVYLNAPLISAAQETALEQAVWASMSAGAVLLEVNCMTAPDDWMLVSAPAFTDNGCGVWVKP